jgi:ABC-2 type transport system permease protein
VRIRRAYRKLASVALQQTIAYRAGFFLGLLGPMFFMVAMLYLWRSLLGNGARAGFSWGEMRGYLVVAFICGNLVSMWTDFSISNRIRDGSVALDLAKPIDYQRARLAETLGVAVFELSSALLVGGVAVAIFGLPELEHRTWSVLLFPLSLLLVIPLKFCISYVTGLACFWTQNYFGVSMARQAVTNLLSGALAPLVFFPGWFQTLAAWLPFRAIASTPALILLGKKTGMDAVLLVAEQAGWVVVLVLGSRFIFSLAIRKLTVQGG